MKITGKPEELTDAVWKELIAKNGHLSKHILGLQFNLSRELDEHEIDIVANSFCKGYLEGSVETFLQFQNRKPKK